MKALYYFSCLTVLLASSTSPKDTQLSDLPEELKLRVMIHAMDPSLSLSRKVTALHQINKSNQKFTLNMLPNDFKDEIIADETINIAFSEYKIMVAEARSKYAMFSDDLVKMEKQAAKNILECIIANFKTLPFARMDPFGYMCKVLRFLLPLYDLDHFYLRVAIGDYVRENWKAWLVSDEEALILAQNIEDVTQNVFKSMYYWVEIYKDFITALYVELFSVLKFADIEGDLKKNLVSFMTAFLKGNGCPFSAEERLKQLKLIKLLQSDQSHGNRT